MPNEMKIMPEGWTNCLVFEIGDWRCGDEEHGLGIHIEKNKKPLPGGVLKRSDMKRIIELFERHLKEFPLT